jgi:hypothetical protein
MGHIEQRQPAAPHQHSAVMKQSPAAWELQEAIPKASLILDAERTSPTVIYGPNPLVPGLRTTKTFERPLGVLERNTKSNLWPRARALRAAWRSAAHL